MLRYLPAVFAIFLQDQFLRPVKLIFGRDVILITANLANQRDLNPMFALFGHKKHLP